MHSEAGADFAHNLQCHTMPYFQGVGPTSLFIWTNGNPSKTGYITSSSLVTPHTLSVPNTIPMFTEPRTPCSLASNLRKTLDYWHWHCRHSPLRSFSMTTVQIRDFALAYGASILYYCWVYWGNATTALKSGVLVYSGHIWRCDTYIWPHWWRSSVDFSHLRFGCLRVHLCLFLTPPSRLKMDREEVLLQSCYRLYMILNLVPTLDDETLNVFVWPEHKAS